MVEVEGLVEGKGELHHPQARAEVAATGGHDLQVAFSDLARHRFQFGDGEAMQLVGMAQRAEMHAFRLPRDPMYALPTGGRRQPQPFQPLIARLIR